MYSASLSSFGFNVDFTNLTSVSIMNFASPFALLT